MSKVFEYFSESIENGGPCCPSVMETGQCNCGEPSNDELAEIENTLDTTSWEDMVWV